MTGQGKLTTLPDVRETTRFLRAIDSGEIRLGSEEDASAVWLGEHTPGTYERFVKPVIDRIGGVLLLLLLSPIILASAAAIAVSLGAPVFYRQTRVGRGGVPFEIVKFRTMERDRRDNDPIGFDGSDRRRTHKTPEDPRHTAVGRFLRASSIDELPQLWNVVRGEMSLVGPRPELLTIVRGYADWQHHRHDVKPGITGLWQIAQRDDDGHMHKHVPTDLVYVRSLSFVTDLRLLLMTIPAIVGRPIRSLAASDAVARIDR